MIDGITTLPFSAQTLSPAEYLSKEKNNREKVIRLSRERYGQSRQMVEEKIARWSGIFDEASSKSSSTTTFTPRPSASGLYDAVCSLCKKKIKVIFLPDGKRPVFCESCLKKAKKGEIEIPSEFLPTRSAESKRNESYLELEKLGIEFSPSQKNISSNTLPRVTENSKSIIQRPQTFPIPTQQTQQKKQIKKEEYETECWVCKQKIKVKFKPDGVRPVYCKECFKNIKKKQLTEK